jgi:hypothetical protein
MTDKRSASILFVAVFGMMLGWSSLSCADTAVLFDEAKQHVKQAHRYYRPKDKDEKRSEYKQAQTALDRLLAESHEPEGTPGALDNAAGEYTVEAIAAGLTAAEANFTNLSLEYTLTHRAWSEPNGPKLVIEGMYAHKIPPAGGDRLQYLRQREFVVDANKHERTVQDVTSSFNGDMTKSLELFEDGNVLDPLKGYVFPGYVRSRCFPLALKEPHGTIWYIGTKKLGEVIRQSRRRLHIEGDSELVRGIPTVKIAGTLEDPCGPGAGLRVWVAPDRGFLPVKLQLIRGEEGAWLQSGLREGEVWHERGLHDLIELAEGMWYPQTIYFPDEPPAAKPEDLAVSQVHNIRNISIDEVPDDLFDFAFPPNTRVLDAVLDVSYTKTE